jgi:hypothetical protein
MTFNHQYGDIDAHRATIQARAPAKLTENVSRRYAWRARNSDMLQGGRRVETSLEFVSLRR